MRILAAALVTIGLAAGPAAANHRPNNEVLVGSAISMTGQYAEPAGRNVNSIKLWVDDVNGHGGLLGHKIVLRLLDDKSDVQTSIKLYEKRYGEKPNYHAGASYGGLQVTEAAVKKAGSFDGEKLREAMATIDVQTIFGHYKADAKGMNSHEGITFQILKGQRRVVWPERLAETKAELPMPEWSKR